jgi:general secretion pathway protein F
VRTFGYIAYTADGKRQTGVMIAEDAAAVSGKLRAQGLFPEEVTPRGEASARPGRGARLNPDLQAVLARQMAVLLAAGMPVDAALEAVRVSGGGKAMDLVAARARAAVLDGAPLSEALERSGAGLPPYVTSAVRAGEASRDLAAVFETIADHLETRGTERAQLAGALIYPAFVATVSLLLCGVLMVTVAPQLAQMFEGTGRPLPPLTRVMLAITDWVRANAVALAVALAAVVVGVPALLRLPTVRDRWHALLLRLPVIGRLMVLEAAGQYLRTLALVIASRQPAVEAVENAAAVLTVRQFRDEADAATRAIRAGAALSTALGGTTFVPPVARQLVEAGEQSARLARMLDRAALLVEGWVRTDRKRIAALLDPALMMLIGGFVLIVVLAILLPIFDLQSALAP